MDAFNIRMLEGPEAAVRHLKYHWHIDDVDALLDRCDECRSCEEACTQHLPILERFKTLREDYRAMQSA